MKIEVVTDNAFSRLDDFSDGDSCMRAVTAGRAAWQCRA